MPSPAIDNHSIFPLPTRKTSPPRSVLHVLNVTQRFVAHMLGPNLRGRRSTPLTAAELGSLFVFHDFADLQRTQIIHHIDPPDNPISSIESRAIASHHAFDTQDSIRIPTSDPLLLRTRTSSIPNAARTRGGFGLGGTPKAARSSRCPIPTCCSARSLAEGVQAWHVPGRPHGSGSHTQR